MKNGVKNIQTACKLFDIKFDNINANSKWVLVVCSAEKVPGKLTASSHFRKRDVDCLAHVVLAPFWSA